MQFLDVEQLTWQQKLPREQARPAKILVTSWFVDKIDLLYNVQVVTSVVCILMVLNVWAQILFIISMKYNE